MTHCSRCNTEKPEGDFYPSALRPRKGRKKNSAWCKVCMRSYYKDKGPRYYYANFGKARAEANRAYIRSVKETLACPHCGESDPVALDFHHRDGEKKWFTLSRMSQHSLETVKAEVAKCDVLCASCHRKHHRGSAFPVIRTPVDDYIAAHAA